MDSEVSIRALTSFSPHPSWAEKYQGFLSPRDHHKWLCLPSHRLLCTICGSASSIPLLLLPCREWSNVPPVPKCRLCRIRKDALFNRYIFLQSAIRFIGNSHSQHTDVNHRSNIDFHDIFSRFQFQVLHDIKQGLGFGAELQKLMSSCLLFIGFSCVVFLYPFLVSFSCVVFLQ